MDNYIVRYKIDVQTCQAKSASGEGHKILLSEEREKRVYAYRIIGAYRAEAGNH